MPSLRSSPCWITDVWTGTHCRKRLEDVMTTDASTSTRVKATRVRQAERIIRNSNDPGVANPSSSSGSGQHKRARFADQESPDPKRDTEMQTGSQEALVTRKRSAETDAERLEEEVTSAEADSERRLALKRKAVGDLHDPDDPEAEDSVKNPLAKLWHRETTLTMKLTCSFCNSVIATLQACMKLVVTNQCVKNPRHLSHMMNADGTTLKTRAANCSTTQLSRRQEPKKLSVIRKRGVWEVVDRPRWVDINKGDETKPSSHSGWRFFKVFFFFFKKISTFSTRNQFLNGK